MRVLWTGNFKGIISISGERNVKHRTLWRNIFDEDIPPNISKDKRGKEITMEVGSRAFHLQKLAEILRIYLGIDEEIWVFIYDETEKGKATNLATTDKHRNYHLIVFNLNHGHFIFRDTVKEIAHECKHAHQNDRISKLMGQSATLETLKRKHDTWDMRLVKSWQVNRVKGYFTAASDLKNYKAQILEVDARAFEEKVFKDLIKDR